MGIMHSDGILFSYGQIQIYVEQRILVADG
ncbi:hypothetical protein LYNGBM3L_31050 [Moorena producens 3L]|uniref:Uncharacterized protein n=1 Tax=Moorena producens 3L TaxID=489825 RepID=F4XTT5_9CYAN|nr:hypothetical protein LYNGBM3L_31050 [Moorena producens 3L]